ncbi:TPA_asm: restriction endonuclease [Salmonella enterica subsp. enterica]|uniref:Restriction endonuclease n=3 Tax=Enterobacteriaceae TaxID=543 RepID=F2Q962_SALET|nr:restriction endonuclease [Salmonella enterica subsp. enterica serovar Agona]CAX68158.1 putative restriction endonuclease, beta subunit [Salmonella enterica subsp. enterica] [Salmonella enterica subsp. enterica serovar Senftenberg]CCR31793.1 Putative Restriction enzyme beta subunit [Salmonella enterica subsp. enterica serovar Agona str. 65.H.72]HAB1649529.1 restriction endonuclease [Salmonella enterica subsp. enterica]HAG4650567.1 restriction endonuclease [Salmonella enterica]
MLLSDLFYVKNGIITSGLNIKNFPSLNSIPFLRPASTQERTIAGWIDKNDVGEKNIYPAGTLFVSTNGEGSHSYSYVSSFEFSCNSDVSVLIPKKDMSVPEKIFYARCITMNRYLFSYGRKPKGSRLKSIDFPTILPEWLDSFSLDKNNILLRLNELVVDDGFKGFCDRKETFSLVPLSDVFDVNYGVNLELNRLEKDPYGVNFVSRTSKNNGVSAKVKIIDGIEPLPSGVLTVAGGGSVLETFVQDSQFYSGRDLYWLNPKVNLTMDEKLYYCSCIRKNRNRYSYGRQANRTLKSLLVPSVSSIPEWVYGAMSRVIDKL